MIDRVSTPGLERAAQMLRSSESLLQGRAARPVEQAGSFGNILTQAISQVNEAQQISRSLQRAFQTGDPSVSLEQTMVAMNTASLSFQMLNQARNRVIQAYQDVMNMQI
jgi:flagellar hook-basal body complex protein FliE